MRARPAPPVSSRWTPTETRSSSISTSELEAAAPRVLVEKDLPMSASAEPFVRDSYFVPVPDEITAHDLPVAGTLPPQLTGVYLRNGPNPRPGSTLPVFAGDGMVHGIRLEAGQARWYRNRYVKTRQ